MGLRLGNLDKKLICICNLNSSRAASSGEFKFKGRELFIWAT